MRNYGLKLEPPKPEDYNLAGFSKLPKEILQADGQWDNYLPPDELQAFPNFEPSCCVTMGTLNCTEILLKRLYNE